ncbi:hypothetical protein E4T56_gene15739, partial [Termitomyces sp. T112]
DDLIHADRHGAIVIPLDIAAKLPEAAELCGRLESRSEALGGDPLSAEASSRGPRDPSSRGSGHVRPALALVGSAIRAAEGLRQLLIGRARRDAVGGHAGILGVDVVAAPADEAATGVDLRCGVGRRRRR